MFDNVKYIVVDYGYHELQMFPFSPTITHKDMHIMVGGEVVSAGFIDEFMQCYGSSSSLNVSSDPNDTKMLKRMFSIVDKKIKKQVWGQVRDQVSRQVRDQVSRQVRDQVWERVRDQVWEQVGVQVRDQVWGQVSRQVRDQVEDQVQEQVWDQVGRQVLEQVEDNLSNFKFGGDT